MDFQNLNGEFFVEAGIQAIITVGVIEGVNMLKKSFSEEKVAAPAAPAAPAPQIIYIQTPNGIVPVVNTNTASAAPAAPAPLQVTPDGRYIWDPLLQQFVVNPNHQTAAPTAAVVAPK